MNFIKRILLGLAAIAFAVGASAQFIGGPTTGSGLDTTSIYILTNNVASITVLAAHKQIIPVGPRGVGLTIELRSTNSATTTNVAFILEGTVDGTRYHDSVNSIPIVYATPVGDARLVAYTNLQATVMNIGNIRHYRIKTITNGNWHGIIVSNVTWSVLQ